MHPRSLKSLLVMLFPECKKEVVRYKYHRGPDPIIPHKIDLNRSMQNRHARTRCDNCNYSELIKCHITLALGLLHTWNDFK